jgi:hypothetical protein
LSKSQPAKLVPLKTKASRGAADSASIDQEECPHCASLRAQCAELRKQRDDAFKALAEEREISNALRLGDSSSYHYVGSHVRHRRGERPLRYDVADAANRILKTYFGFLHGATRGTVSRVLQLARVLGRNIEP